ncbi:MAG: hypothetical protein M9901_05235 [Lentimicrobium sp.]|nr:hypothetical protein [Lentimicrobium sp.]
MFRTLFVLLMLLMQAPLLSGQTIYTAGRDGAWQFGFSSTGNANRYNNQFINQLALAHRKIPEKTAFTFFYRYNIEVRYGHGSMLEVMLTFHPAVCSGDVQMRGFDLSPVLIPAQMKCRVVLEHPVNGVILQSGEMPLRTDSLRLPRKVISFPDSLWREGCLVKADFMHFGFDAESYARAEKELFYIRDYEAASAMADTLEKRIRAARINRHTAAEAFAISVYAGKTVRLLREASSVNSLILPGKDPVGLAEKQRIAAYKAGELDSYLLQQGAKGSGAGNLYKNLGSGYAGQLEDALRLSQKVDYYSSPFFYRLFANGISASHLFRLKELARAYAGSRGMPDPDWGRLSREMIFAYLLKSNELIADDRFAEAVDLLSAGVKFCSVNPAAGLPDTLTRRLKEARSGLTAAYTRVVKKALKSNLPVIAEKYLAEAEQYVLKYNLDDGEATGFTSLYQQMADMYLVNAGNLLQKGNYNGVLSELDKAGNIASTRQGIVLGHTYTSVLKKAVDGRFDEMAGLTKVLLQKGNYQRAGQSLDEALDFAGNYPVYQPDMTLVDSLRRMIAGQTYHALLAAAWQDKLDRNKEQLILHMTEAALTARNAGLEHVALFDSLVQEGVIPYLNGLYSTGRLKLWAGEPEEALGYSQKASQLAAVMGVANLPALKTQQDELARLADESLCSRIRGELESLIGEASALLQQNRFDQASEVIIEARELIYSRSYCGLSTQQLNRVTEKYRHPVRWNEMHRTALQQIAEGDYTEGIRKLNEAEALFTHYRLDTLGLVSSGLFELAMATDELRLIDYTTGYYITRGHYDKALQLTERLRSSGMGEDAARPHLESLGRGLALRDLSETGEVDVKLMLRIYTGGNKWYRRFAEVYRFHILNH